MAAPIDTFIAYIINRRNELGLSQRQLAEAAGMSAGSYANLELGRVTRAPRADTIDKLAKGLRVSPDALMALLRGEAGEAPAPSSAVSAIARVPGLKTAAQLGAPGEKRTHLATAVHTRRGELGMSVNDLALAAGIPASVLTALDDGKRPAREELKKLAAALGVPLAFLLTPAALPVPAEAPSAAAAPLPYVGEVGCGKKLFLDHPELRLVPAGLAAKADFFVVAQGESMTKARIYPGDKLYVKAQDWAKDGQIVIANVADEGATCKLYRKGKKQAFLYADSLLGEFPPIPVDEDVNLLGVVVYVEPQGFSLA